MLLLVLQHRVQEVIWLLGKSGSQIRDIFRGQTFWRGSRRELQAWRRTRLIKDSKMPSKRLSISPRRINNRLSCPAISNKDSKTLRSMARISWNRVSFSQVGVEVLRLRRLRVPWDRRRMSSYRSHPMKDLKLLQHYRGGVWDLMKYPNATASALSTFLRWRVHSTC